MCHMVADNIEELHKMAQALGLRQWFQNQGRHQHYDLSKAKRKIAVGLGAIEVNERRIIQIIKEQQQ